MNPTRKSLALAGTFAIACMVLCGPTARAQGFSFGYSGPGGSVGVTTGNYGYYGGGYYGGGYYGGGYYGGGYPVLAPGAFVAGPVAPAYVRPPVILGGPLVVPRPYIAARPYVRYGYPGNYYRRGWR
jgi:hypothetical protein